MKRFLRGFVYAGRGIALCLCERNFRFHLCAAAFVTWFALRFYELSRGEWAALLLTFGAVLSAETVNTALERLCDRVCKDKDELIGKCKDCAAGAVLLSAIAAVGVGIALFADGERLSAVWAFFVGAWYRGVILAVAIAAAVCFVLLPERGKQERK